MTIERSALLVAQTHNILVCVVDDGGAATQTDRRRAAANCRASTHRDLLRFHRVLNSDANRSRFSFLAPTSFVLVSVVVDDHFYYGLPNV